MSSFPNFTIKQMLECGVHFGHKRMLWNPKMASYIYCERNGVHVINLQKTAELLHNALHVLYQTIKKNPRAKVLFVGTKHQASPFIKKYALLCGQFFVNHRWLGGMLTNWGTVSKSIQKLSEYEGVLLEASVNGAVKYNKKELLEIDRSREKLDRSLGGIREMRHKPDLIFILDTNKEKIAIQEAKKLNIPVMAVIDTNSSIEDIEYFIPGNDDSSKSIEFYCDLVSQAVLAGLEDSLVESGVDPSEAKVRVREAIERDIKKTEDKKVDFAKVQEARERLETAKLSKKRFIEVKLDSDLENIESISSKKNAFKEEVVKNIDGFGQDVKVARKSIGKSEKPRSVTKEINVDASKKPLVTKVKTKIEKEVKVKSSEQKK